jgi:hypothetical protein
MSANTQDREPDPVLHKLYPELGREELLLAEEKLDEYLCFAMRLHERIVNGSAEYSRVRFLTKNKVDRMIDHKGSNQNQSSTNS